MSQRDEYLFGGDQLERSLKFVKVLLAVYLLFQAREIWVNFADDPLRYAAITILLGAFLALYLQRIKFNDSLPHLPRIVDFLLVLVLNLLGGMIFTAWYLFLAINTILSVHGPRHFWLLGLYYLGWIGFSRNWSFPLDIGSLELVVLDSLGYAFAVLFGFYLRVIFTQARNTAILYNDLKQSHERLEQYARDVEVLGAAQERNRIAREIHDTLGHTLTALIMQLEAGEMVLPANSGPAIQRIARARELGRQAMVNLREAVQTLRHESAEDFEANMRGAAAALGLSESGFVLQITGDYRQRSAPVQLCIYRALQEALTNAVRHGQATEVRAELNCAEATHLIIQDNGTGTGAVEKGFGLMGMEERVKGLKGSIKLSSAPGQGFRLDIWLPGKKGGNSDGQSQDSVG